MPTCVATCCRRRRRGLLQGDGGEGRRAEDEPDRRGGRQAGVRRRGEQGAARALQHRQGCLARVQAVPQGEPHKSARAARRLVSRARRTQGGGDPIDGPTKSEGSKDEQKAALGSFIKVNTGLSVFIGKGQIGAFDDLAEKFVGARCPAPFFSAVRPRCYSALTPTVQSPGGDKGALAAAEKLLGDKEVVTDDDDKSNAEYYIKTMKRVNDKGADYPKTELARLKKSAPPNTEPPGLRPPARRLPTGNREAGTEGARTYDALLGGSGGREGERQEEGAVHEPHQHPLFVPVQVIPNSNLSFETP